MLARVWPGHRPALPAGGRRDCLPALRALAAPTPLPIAALALAFSLTGAGGQEAEQGAGSSSGAAPREAASVFDFTYEPPREALLLRPEGEAKARALALFYRGLMQRSAGDADGTVASFREALEIDPGNLDLAARTARYLARAGRGDEALAVLERAVAGNPGDPRALLTLSEHCLTYAEDDEALEERGLRHAREAVAAFPSDPRAHAHLIAYFLAAADRAAAEAALEEALAQEAADPAYFLTLGRLAQGVWPFRFGLPETREANLARVAAVYERALGLPAADTGTTYAVAEFYRDVRQFGRAAELFREVYEREPDHLDARESYARVLVGDGRHDEALAAFENLVAINPFDPRVRTVVADYYWTRYSQALQEYEEFLGEFEDVRVREFAASRKPDDETGRRAATHFLEAVRLGQPTARNFLLASLLLMETGQLDLAVSTLQRARFIHPDNPEFPRELARAFRAQDRLDDALGAYRDAEDVARSAGGVEEMEGFLDGRFYFSYGATAEQAEQYELAADLFRKAIAETPEDSPEDVAITYNYLGYMWLEQGINTEEAGELIRYALDADPFNSSYVDSIGWYHFRKGDYQSALAELLRAEQLMGRDYDIAFAVALEHGVATEADRDPYEGVDPEVLDHVAQTYAALGEFDKAVGYAERAAAQASATEEMKARLETYRSQAGGTGAPPAEADPGDAPPGTPPAE